MMRMFNSYSIYLNVSLFSLALYTSLDNMSQVSTSNLRHRKVSLNLTSNFQRYESNFLNSIRTDATRKAYKFYFKKYREFVKGDLIDNTDIKIIESQIIDFLVSLRNRGLTYSSVKSHFCAIAHFYIMNDVVLIRNKIIKFINKEEKYKVRNAAYTAEQIHK